jgi:hypothetical protein
VARFFIDSAKMCGVLDPSGLLRHSALDSVTRAVPKIYIAPPVTHYTPQASVQPPPETITIPDPNALPHGTATEKWEYGDGERSIRLVVPVDITMAEWNRLRRQIEAMRPEMREAFSSVSAPNSAVAS